MKYIKRKPDIQVEIRRPDYSSSVYRSDQIVVFSWKESETDSTDLLSYEFTEMLSDPTGSFSLSLVPRVDKDGKSWATKIHKRDLVFIKEFGETRFCGLVRNVRYTARMSEEGKPSRSISVSGMGMGGLLATFNVVLDQRVLKGVGSTSESQARTIMERIAQKMAKGTPLKNAITAVGDSFFELVKAIGLELNIPISISAVLANFIDYDTYIDKTVVHNYPVAYSLYEMGENNLWSIWNGMMNPPLNELFCRWESDKLGIYMRETPFDPDKWSQLKTHRVDPVTLQEVDLGSSDNEVKTFFLGMLPGSGISQDLALVLTEFNRVPTISKQLFSKYGLLPMYTEFRYFDKDELLTFTNTETTMRELSQKLLRWYEPNSEFLNGTIKLHSMADNYMRIGDKLAFMGGEFYIEGVSRSWRYGASMNTVATITRGGKYSAAGEYDGEIEDLEQKARVLS